jgi:hypothetical protein
MSILSYQELRVLMSASLLSGRPPSEWDQALPLADAMAMRLLDLAGLPKPGGVDPATETQIVKDALEEHRLASARDQARKKKP